MTTAARRMPAWCPDGRTCRAVLDARPCGAHLAGPGGPVLTHARVPPGWQDLPGRSWVLTPARARGVGGPTGRVAGQRSVARLRAAGHAPRRRLPSGAVTVRVGLPPRPCRRDDLHDVAVLSPPAQDLVGAAGVCHEDRWIARPTLPDSVRNRGADHGLGRREHLPDAEAAAVSEVDGERRGPAVRRGPGSPRIAWRGCLQ